MKTKRYLIIGGPGTGKSTLVKTLKDLGYQVFEEAARRTIIKNIELKNDALPWLDRDAFDRELLNIMLTDYKNARVNKINFFDGGLIDIIAWRKYLKKDTSEFEYILNCYPYEKLIFSPIPWEDLYYSDQIRPMDFNSAKKINSSIVAYYKSIGHLVIELSKQTPIQRAKKVLKIIKSSD